MTTPAGCWSWVAGGDFAGRPALFLDRDGVLVEEVGYLHRVQDVALAPGAPALVAAANRAGAAVVLVTNQSGVARGLFGWPEFEAVQGEIDRRLAASSARLDAVFACGASPAGSGDPAVADHPWRKPNPGMILAARERMGIDLARSVLVGDRAQDLAAARAAGLPLGVHVGTGHGMAAEEQTLARALATAAFAVRLAPGPAELRLDTLLDSLARPGEGERP